jgi:transaldolase
MEGLDDPFILKFEYNDKPHILEVRPWIQQYKISYKVTVEEHEVTFEEDEEGQLRAIADVNTHPGHTIDQHLLQDIARRIQEAMSGE